MAHVICVIRLGCIIAIAVSQASCERPPTPPPAAKDLPSAKVKETSAPARIPMDEQEVMAALAAQGAQALPGLSTTADLHHGATWYQGNIPAEGSAAYLYLGKLGEGAATLRFVVRHEGPRAANFGNCTVLVDAVEAGSFSPSPNKFENLPGGNVMQLADIHFDDVRPVVLAMINGQSAVVRTADGAEIRLSRSELDEMRRVLSAYLHLQGQP